MNNRNTNNDDISTRLPIRMISKIISGFGRGSKDLGIPTANLSRQDLTCKLNFDSLPCGIYWGYARIESSTTSSSNTSNCTSSNRNDLLYNDKVYKAAISIGYNPCYNNQEKNIEPHLIALPNDPARHASTCGETQFNSDFYGNIIRLSIVGYLRPELPFEGLDKLVIAIKNDIIQAETLGSLDLDGCSTTDDDVVKVMNNHEECTTINRDIKLMEWNWVASSDDV